MGNESPFRKGDLMSDYDTIETQLPGNDADRERRGRILGDFLAALNDTGVEDAVTVIDRPLADLEDAFLDRLHELERLL